MDDYGDDELTTVLPSPYDAVPVTHAPARSYRPKDVPASSVYLPEDDFLDDLDLFDEEFAAPARAAASAAGGQPPASRGRDRWIAVIAGTTTIAALALVILVAMRMTAKEPTQLVVMSAPGTAAVPVSGAAPALQAPSAPVPVPAPAPVAQPVPEAPPAADSETLDLDDVAHEETAASGGIDLSALAADQPSAAPPPAPPKAAPSRPRPKPVVVSAAPRKPAARPAPTPKAKPVAKASAAAAAPKTPAAGTGYVTIVCDPACDSVTVGGNDLGPSPVVRSAVSAGPQTVTLKAKGHKSKTLNLEVEAGKTTARRVRLSP